LTRHGLKQFIKQRNENPSGSLIFPMISK